MILLFFNLNAKISVFTKPQPFLFIKILFNDHIYNSALYPVSLNCFLT